MVVGKEEKRKAERVRAKTEAHGDEDSGERTGASTSDSPRAADSPRGKHESRASRRSSNADTELRAKPKHKKEHGNRRKVRHSDPTGADEAGGDLSDGPILLNSPEVLSRLAALAKGKDPKAGMDAILGGVSQLRENRDTMELVPWYHQSVSNRFTFQANQSSTAQDVVKSGAKKLGLDAKDLTLYSLDVEEQEVSGKGTPKSTGY